MKAPLSHWSEVFSLIRHARSCWSPKYLSTVSPGRKQRETNVSNATKGSGTKITRRTCLPAVNPPFGHGLIIGIPIEPRLSA